MPAVARAKPQEIFTANEWARLTRRSLWRGPALVIHAWVLIALALAASVLVPHPITWVFAVMVVGARQLGLGILMHEAAHGLLHPNAGVNGWLGQWLCAAPIGAELKSYRAYHLAHHKFTQEAEDPDKPLSEAFPVSRWSLARKVVRDLTGQTFVKQRTAAIAAAFGRGDGDEASAIFRSARRGLIQFLIVNGALTAGLAAFGLWPALIVWWVAMATWFPLVTRIRNIAEHAVVESGTDPFTHARTTHANPLERLFIAPYWVHFHAEHHLFMYLPCWRLAQAHRLLMAKGYGARMTIAKGYGHVLAQAGSA